MAPKPKFDEKLVNQLIECENLTERESTFRFSLLNWIMSGRKLTNWQILKAKQIIRNKGWEQKTTNRRG